MSSGTIIIGGGLAGLSAAYHLKGEYSLYESRRQFGGIASSFSIDGFTFDHAIHILFTRDPYASEFIRELLGENFDIRARSSWLYSHGVMTPYPYQANMRGLPKGVIVGNLCGLLAARFGLHRRPPKNFEDWIVRTFGWGIAKHCMLPLNEKVWGVAPRTMSTDWMHDRVPQPRLRDVLTGLRRHDDRGRFGTNGTFWYPKRGGMGALTESLRKRVSNLHAGSRCETSDTQSRTVTFADGVCISYDALIATLPLPQLVAMIKDVPPDVADAVRTLRWNRVHTVALGIARPRISDKHWIYFPSRDILFQRISFPMNFADDLVPRGTSSIMAEITEPSDGSLCTDTLIEETVRQLRTIGILRPTDRILTQHRMTIEPAYVIYDEARPAALRIIRQYLHAHHIIPCGRFGDWEYLNMDQTILSGKRAAKSVGLLSSL